MAGGIIITQYIVFYGEGVLDIILYISAVLRNLSYSVLVADLSEDNNFYFIQTQNSCDIFTHKKVDFYKADIVSLKDFKRDIVEEEYSFVILYHNKPFKEIYDYLKPEFIYVSSNMEYRSIKSLYSFIKETEGVNSIIFRDIYDNGINASYIISSILRDDYIKKLFKQGRVFEIHEDYEDKSYFINMIYEGITGFKRQSREISKLIKSIVKEVSCREDRAIEIAYKKAREGKIYEHSFLE